MNNNVHDVIVVVLVLWKCGRILCSSFVPSFFPISCLQQQNTIGWECDYCQRPIFSVVAALTSTTGSSSGSSSNSSSEATRSDGAGAAPAAVGMDDDDDDETMMPPPKVGGCPQCFGRRTCTYTNAEFCYTGVCSKEKAQSSLTHCTRAILLTNRLILSYYYDRP